MSRSRVQHFTTEPNRTPSPDVQVMCPTLYHRATQDSFPGCPGRVYTTLPLSHAGLLSGCLGHVSNTLPPSHAGFPSRLSRSCVKHFTTEPRTCPTPNHRATQDSHPSCPGHVYNTLPPSHAGLPPRLSGSRVQHLTTETRRTLIPAVQVMCPTPYHRDTQDSHPGCPGHVSNTLPPSHAGLPPRLSNTLPLSHARVQHPTTEPRRTPTQAVQVTYATPVCQTPRLSNTLPLSHARVQHPTIEPRRTPTPADQVTYATPYHLDTQDSHPGCPGHVSNTLPPRHAELPPRLSGSRVKHFITEPRRTSTWFDPGLVSNTLPPSHA